MNNLVVELLVEELPPKALNALGEAFSSLLVGGLVEQGLVAAPVRHTAYASPRRLAVHVCAVFAQAPDKPVSHKLMPVTVGLDSSGNPTPALLKKLQALGAPADAPAPLRRVTEGKAEVLYLDSLAIGVTLVQGLQRALNDAITKLPIPKVMSYQLGSDCNLPGWTSVSFVRPAHGLLAVHGVDVVPVQALGLRAGNSTSGHRFESSRTDLVINHADDYATVLERDGAVIAGFSARRSRIVAQIDAACRLIGGGVHPVSDELLLDEVTALVERPNVLVCSFDEQFLQVPQECLILTMKANQKYFPLLDAAGKLTRRFLVVSNISPADASLVIGGNERVVRPRLADARFFFDQDRRVTLASRVAGLDKVVYHNRLGSQGERGIRVQAIAAAIALRLGDMVDPTLVQSAASLSKADLLTDMVGEFPDLQGVMGGYYARHDGLGDAVALAIEDHYRPRFAGDALPRNLIGITVALSDKLETLAGMFGIGNLPTGEKDPFALRRHALGVVRMLIERSLPLPCNALTRLAYAAFPSGLLQDNCAMLDEFLVERLKGYLRELGYTPAEVEAVTSARKMTDWHGIPKRLAAVRAFGALPQAPALAAANKRIANILKKAPDVDPHVSELLLKEPAEIALYAAMQQVAGQAAAQFDAGDYAASLQTLAVLRDPVDAFFEGVMVNATEMDVRMNRLGLLRRLHESMNSVADLARLAG